MQNAITYAKQNPTSSYAQELQQRIQSGNYNDVLKQMGIDTSKYGQPAAPAVAPGVPAVQAAAPKPDYADSTDTSSPITQGIGNFVNDTVSNAKNAISGAGTAIVNDANTEGAKADAAATPLAKAGDTEQGIQHVAGDLIGGAEGVITAPITTSVKNISDLIAQSPAVQKIAMALPDFQQKLSDLVTAHPEVAKNISDLFNIGGALIAPSAVAEGTPTIDAAASGLEDAASTAADKVADAGTAVVNKASDLVSSAKDAQTARVVSQSAAQATKDTNTTITALNPDLKGAKLTAAYKEAITGSRTITPNGLFSEQSLSPGQRTVGLGQRLSSDIPLSEGDNMPKVILTKDPVKNTTILRNALTDTETKLTTALRGDPDINYNADKPTLYEALDTARKNVPNEFKIKDNKELTTNVFNFANKVVAQSDDSIEGLRDARTTFDNQARREYPNAFNPDGSVNVKTAAGNAVKTARDVFNEHLYNTAPKGSDIQKLIGREADIFQASNPVASKAAANEGGTIPSQIVRKVKAHPVAASIGAAATAATALEAAKGLGL